MSNLKEIKRTFETIISEIIKFYIKDNSFLSSTYLIYTSLRNSKILQELHFFKEDSKI